MRVLLASLLLFVVLAVPAQARHRHAAPAVAVSCDFPNWCPNAPPSSHIRTSGPESGARGAFRVAYSGQIVGHPAGCPRRAFCGCGASVRVFGHAVRSLWLAANWLRYPRVPPAPGMVAARRGHVFVLESYVGGNTWMVYDANSGGHATRIHARSLSGYTVVNPHA